MRKTSKAPLITFMGIDGSGKSSTAVEAAETLTSIFTGLPVHVTDSNGLQIFYSGEQVAHIAPEIESLEPTANMGRINQIAHLASFAIARRSLNSFHGNGLHFSVRDPHRIDPAVYAAAYNLPIIGRKSPQDRLLFFSKLTLARPADMLIHLAIEPEEARLEDDTDLDVHEDIASLTKVAEELPVMAKAYAGLFNTQYTVVQGQSPSTTDHTVDALCSLIQRSNFQ